MVVFEEVYFLILVVSVGHVALYQDFAKFINALPYPLLLRSSWHIYPDPPYGFLQLFVHLLQPFRFV